MIYSGQVVHVGPDSNLVGREVYKYDHANKQAAPSPVFVLPLIRGTGTMQVEAESFASFGQRKPLRSAPLTWIDVIVMVPGIFNGGQIDKNHEPSHLFFLKPVPLLFGQGSSNSQGPPGCSAPNRMGSIHLQCHSTTGCGNRGA